MAQEFKKYCLNGDIDAIKKMSLQNCDLDYMFIMTCENGHYDIVKYLVILYKTRNQNYNYKMINIHSNDEAGFKWACYNGNYNIVKYLVELHKNDENYKMINIHSDGAAGFRLACMKGHYMIVKYLVELYKTGNQKDTMYYNITDVINNYDMINIHSYDEYGFRMAYKGGHINIVKYLMTLYKNNRFTKTHQYKSFNNYLMIFSKFDKYKL